MKRLAGISACLTLAACGTASFTLPPPGTPERGRYEWRPAPALVQPRADFDAVQAAAPRVFRFGQFFYNLYSAHDGEAWTTGLTASLDGLDWNLGRKVLAADARIWEAGPRAAFGSALVLDGLIHYWYTAGEPAQIGLARSHDGRSWRREEESVLSPGGEKDWDSASTGHPSVLQLDGRLFMFFVGTNAAGQHALGLARSPDGVKWTRLRANPVLSLAEAQAAAVWRAHGSYWLLAARDATQSALLRSQDGIAWKPAGLVLDAPMPSVLPGGDGHAAVWFNLGPNLGYGRLEWIPE